MTDQRTDDGSSGRGDAAGGRAAGGRRRGTGGRTGRRDREPSEQSGDAATARDPDVLRARLDLLASEVERLRRAHARASEAQYRRTALVLALLGVAALAGAWAFPELQEVLVALGGTGLFGAALTYFLTPERFVAASVAERIHQAHAANHRALLADLDLSDVRVYVPTPDAPDPARLFVPAREEYRLPDRLDHLLLPGAEAADRGVALVPTGGPLYEAVDAAEAGAATADPRTLAAYLADAAVETYELASSVAVESDRDGERVVVTVADPAFGDLSAPDHPIVSLIGTGMADGLERPVETRVVTGGSEDEPVRLVYDWSTDDEGAAESAGAGSNEQ